MRINHVRQCIIVSLALISVGCSVNPQPRLNDLLGNLVSQSSGWPSLERVGLVVHSDSAGPEASLPITQHFLETLGRRSEEFLVQRCKVSSVVPIAFPSSTLHPQIRRELIAKGKEHGLSHLLVVLLSGRESSGPVTLGEERMMTQMSGTSVESIALSEVVLLRLADYVLIFNLQGLATETLELLDAPIGKDQPTRKESLDILRAQAAQQALDRSLHGLGQRCEGILKKT